MSLRDGTFYSPAIPESQCQDFRTFHDTIAFVFFCLRNKTTWSLLLVLVLLKCNAFAEQSSSSLTETLVLRAGSNQFGYTVTLLRRKITSLLGTNKRGCGSQLRVGRVSSEEEASSGGAGSVTLSASPEKRRKKPASWRHQHRDINWASWRHGRASGRQQRSSLCISVVCVSAEDKLWVHLCYLISQEYLKNYSNINSVIYVWILDLEKYSIV